MVQKIFFGGIYDLRAKIYIIFFCMTKLKKMKPIVAQGHITCCKIDWLWFRPPLEYIFTFIFSFLRWWVPLLNTQYLQNSAKSGKRSVLTLHLPCCVRVWDTAWSWFYYFKFVRLLMHANFRDGLNDGNVRFTIVF